MPKRKPYKEGDWFAIPLESGYVLGRIARVGRRGGILLGYLFGPPLPTEPNIEDTRNLTPWDAFDIGMFGDLGLVQDGWPIIPYEGEWGRKDWPMPVFGRVAGLKPGVGYAVRYDEDELTKYLGKAFISTEQALGLPRDHLAGHLWLQHALERYFREGPELYDPKDRMSAHIWFHGLPRE